MTWSVLTEYIQGFEWAAVVYFVYFLIVGTSVFLTEPTLSRRVSVLVIVAVAAYHLLPGFSYTLQCVAAAVRQYHWPREFSNIVPYHQGVAASFWKSVSNVVWRDWTILYPVLLFGSIPIVTSAIRVQVYNSQIRRLLKVLVFALIGFLSFGISVLLSVLWLAVRSGRRTTEMILLDGIEVFERKREGLDNLREALGKDKCDGIEIYPSLRIPRFLESQNFLIAGAQGCGKTQFLNRVLKQTRERGDRNVILDVKGDYTELFGEESDTVILSVTDARSVPWDIAADIQHEIEAVEFADMLVPMSDSADGSSKFFGEAARDCISGAILSCIESNFGRWTIADVVAILGNTEQLVSVLRKHKPQALSLIQDHANNRGGEQSAGVFGNIRARTKLLDYMARAWPESVGGFSIKKWVRDGEESPKKTLILQYESRYSAVSSFVVSQFMELLFKQLISLDDTHTRRINVFMDELSVYRYLPSFSEAVKLSRSKGFPLYATVQEVATLDAIYRQHGGKENILNGFANKLIGRQASEAAARHWVESFGTNVYEKIARTKSQTGGKTTISQTRHEVRQPALTTGKLLSIRPASLKRPADLYVCLAGHSIVRLPYKVIPAAKKYPRNVVPEWLRIRESQGDPVLAATPAEFVEDVSEDLVVPEEKGPTFEFEGMKMKE